jgi:fermentation-respiration switch protein FrsA (DUF1100 family)
LQIIQKPYVLLILIVTVLAAALATVMGLAGTTTKILLLAWIFVPPPIVLLIKLLKPLPRSLRIASTTYISVSILATVLLLLTVGWTGSETALHPEVCKDMDEISQYPDLAQQLNPISFTAQDGTSLKGWLAIQDSHRAVVLLHGYRCDKRAMLLEAKMLYDAGMTVLLFDFRHSGESDGKFVSFGYYEKQDVLAAVNLIESLDGRGNDLKGRGRTSIGLLGESNGAATAILFAAENPGRVDALVVDSTFKSLDSAISQAFTYFVGLPAFPFAPVTVWISELRTGLKRGAVKPEESVADLIETPILLIHGLRDAVISAKDSEAIYSNALQPKQIWLVPDAEHGEASEVATDEYRERVVNFFKLNLRQETS